jgi:tetratricopeptide (TPR) repeat protein
MDSRSFKVLLIGLITLVLVSCSSGKKSLENGDYDKAVYTAVNRLKDSPNNKKAFETLAQGYEYALSRHLTRVEDAKLTNDVFKWEEVARNYQAINNLANAVDDCPVCMEAVPQPKKFINELADVQYFAAEARYTNAKKLLDLKTRVSAKEAYFDFERAEQYYPNYKDARILQDSAYWAAVFKVVVEPVEVNSRLYKLSNEYFQDKITEFMLNYETKSFIRFYSPEEASRSKLVPDQVLSLNFDDFVVGQTYVKERIEDIKLDSVKIGETKSTPAKAIYGTVSGKLSTFEKTISSAGLLDFQIRDFKTNKIISREKMPGTFIWADTWATYRGDERALTNADKNLLT